MTDALSGLFRGATGAVVLAAFAAAQASTPTLDAKIVSELEVSHYELQRLEVPAAAGERMFVELELEGQPITLDLRPHSLRAPDFQLLVQGADGALRPTEAPAPTTFVGEVVGLEGSWVRAARGPVGLDALIELSDGMRFSVQPLSEVEPGADPAMHVVFDARDDFTTGQCGTLPGIQATPATPPPTTQALGTGLSLCELGVDTDTQFYGDNGNNLNATINDIEGTLNGVEGVYQLGVQVVFEITVMVIRTAEPDPYTTNASGALLDEVGDEWGNALGFVRRDTVHLFSGRNLSGGTLGVANLGALCNGPSAVGLSQRVNSFTSRVGLIAHEIGHNFGAPHCNGTVPCWIMCAGLGGCNGLGGPAFAPVTVNTILNFLVSADCITDLANPLTVPFLFDFEDVLGNVAWTSRQNVQINTLGVNEPSGTRSLNMDSFNADEFADDYLRSNVFLLGGESDLSVSYYTQHRGVEAGESLVLEYMNSAEDWILLNTVVSNGVDQNDFVLHQVELPAPAYHNGFRIQFRTQGDSNDDDWFIDDVAIDTTVTCPGTSSYCATSPNSVGSGGFMLSGGTTNVSANDFALQALSLPSGQFGIFYYGPAQTQLPFGDGFRCVDAGGIGTFRLPPQTIDGFGFVERVLDLTNPPQPNGQISAGQTWNFQFWYRDPAAGGSGFNLTDGLEAVFCP